MNKIIAVSLVADSADIIESFVRHTLTYADEMLVVDHAAADGTGEVLRALQEEGLPLCIERYEAAELCHDEIMTDLMHRAFDEHGADIVVPVDADEFLVTEDAAKPCRAVLSRLRTNMTFYAWHWMYELEEPEKDAGEFLLSRPLRRKKRHEPVQKAIIGREAARSYPLLAQGTHYLYRMEGEERVPAPALPISFLHFAHFQWRGPLHTAVKVLNGWIGNAAKYSVHTARCYYWKEHFDTVFEGGEPPVALSPEERERVQKLVLPQGRIELRYTKRSTFSPLQSLMRLSEQLAQDFAEARVLVRRKLVSIIVPYFGDLSLWRRTLESAASQTYPYMEVVALDFVGDASELSEALAALSMPHVVVPALSGGWGAALSRAAHGTYIQWLLPGDRLFPEKIAQMATTLELDDELDFVIADAAGAADDALPQFVFRMKQPHCVVAAGAWHRKFVLSAGASPEGGLSGALLRRSVLDACAWLETAFFRARFFPLAAFVLLFQTRGDLRVGVFEIPLLTHEVQEAAELPWHPAEWAALLLSCGGELKPEVFQKARASLAERAQDVFRREDACRAQDFACARKVFEEIFSALPE
ncbi:glycosyltransferase family 2 protein [Selenomonas sputigena]|uniref:glycosyltransferase family 2 protein n=1 Tax=Selenomonas sputigena TaxID=69823 RepID=UPI002230C2E1|nr:glycosyltransferase family 2 protein [Selenomonas sputigena]UZD44457.1 glycosyltransferase family 2 protein [Selenomonas sputigena]